MSDYLPEGMRTTAAGLSRQQILQAVGQPKILEARAVMCDSAHNLIVELGSMRGIIPKEECALGIREGTVRDIAILSRVNTPGNRWRCSAAALSSSTAWKSISATCPKGM